MKIFGSEQFISNEVCRQKDCSLTHVFSMFPEILLIYKYMVKVVPLISIAFRLYTY